MILLEHFDTHLEAISGEDWKSLFDLIPEIKAADTFGVVEQENSMFPKIKPCKIGMNGPPTIAITRKAEAYFASSPKPCNAMPQIVGNINDMQKDIITKLYSPQRPSIKMAPEQNNMAINASIINNLPESINFKKYVKINLPIKKITNAAQA